MYFLPYCKFEVKSSKTPSEISRILNLCIEKRRYRAIEQKKHFVGKADENGFSIVDSGYIEGSSMIMRNSFSPVLQGKYVPDKNGTRIMITSSVHWLLLLSTLFFVVLLPMFVIGELSVMWIFLAVHLFVYFFMMVCFNLGIKTTKRKLDILMKLIA